MHLKVNQIKSNPNNPRTIKDANFKKLVQSLNELPENWEELTPKISEGTA